MALRGFKELNMGFLKLQKDQKQWPYYKELKLDFWG